MRFIGNKENLVDRIYQTIQAEGIKGMSFFDFFSGTTSVASFFKRKGYQVFSSDLLYFSYVLQQAYIVNNRELRFEKLINYLSLKSKDWFSSPLQNVVEYLNQIEMIEGFIVNNYTPQGTKDLPQVRMYFSGENGRIIDSIRQKIEDWKTQGLLLSQEYYVLLACLIETVPYYSNIAGVYAAYQKKWDPRAIKRMKLRPIKYVINKKDNYSFNENSIRLTRIKADIYYLDPPYNQRQYAPNYHILETIAKYDSPEITGITGMRPYQEQKSKFCNKKTAYEELINIAMNGNYSTLLLSYNSEGLMEQNEIISILKNYGEVKLIEYDYRRFKSNNNRSTRVNKYIKEQLFILRKYA